MTIERTEILTSGPAEGLAGLLGVDLPDLGGAGLPALWHWAYLLDRPRQADLGADGHPVRGVVPVPPGPGATQPVLEGQSWLLHPQTFLRDREAPSVPARNGRRGPCSRRPWSS